jgi:PAS domain S-box-containing protein
VKKYSPVKLDPRTILDGIDYKAAANNNPQAVFDVSVLVKGQKPTDQTQSRMLESLGLGILSTDIDGLVTYVNDTTLNLTGWRREQVLGKNMLGLMSPDFMDKTRHIVEVTSSGNPWYGEMPIQCSDGSYLRGWAYINPIRNDQGKVTGSIGVIFDIKDRSQTTDILSGLTETEKPPEATPARLNTAEMLQEFTSKFQAVKEQMVQLTEVLYRGELLIQSMNHLIEASPQNSIRGIKVEKAYQKLQLQVYCLGSLRVCSPSKQIQQWQSQRAKSIFEFLISKRKSPIIKDKLMEALWPDYNARAAANNLKTSIHDLRQTLAPLFEGSDFPCVLFSNDAYFINPEIDLTIDAEDFEKLWTTGKKLEKEGKTGEAISSFEAAEALYQGDYLQDELYDEWIVPRRESLKDIFLLILNKLADHSMHTSDYETCINYCHKILNMDNCREDAYRLLMCCYSRLGRRNKAVHWYETCLKTLNDEFNNAPSDETNHLYSRVKKGETI